jgi:hypothetical protein
MAFDTTIADGLLLRRRIGWSEVAALIVALILALGVAAWTADSDPTGALVSAALPAKPDQVAFADRFFPGSRAGLTAEDPALLSPAPSARTVDEFRVRAAKDLLARRLLFRDQRFGFVDELSADLPREILPRADVPKADLARIDDARPNDNRATSGIPLPRSRPAAADLEPRSGPAMAQAENAAKPDDRSLLQRLSDLLPGRITLASLTPESGLSRRAPDLAALGYEPLTAVYDISAHAVYLPNGIGLEAHSGMGTLRDDPDHVSVPNFGATPPAIYELKPREKLFHGVQALRMTPIEGTSTPGRSGLLAHSFMLGPNGDSNGCVSIRDYDQFLKAFNDGEINRLVVVPSLSGAAMAARRSTSPS